MPRTELPHKSGEKIWKGCLARLSAICTKEVLPWYKNPLSPNIPNRPGTNLNPIRISWRKTFWTSCSPTENEWRSQFYSNVREKKIPTVKWLCCKMAAPHILKKLGWTFFCGFQNFQTLISLQCWLVKYVTLRIIEMRWTSSIRKHKRTLFLLIFDTNLGDSCGNLMKKLEGITKTKLQKLLLSRNYV